MFFSIRHSHISPPFVQSSFFSPPQANMIYDYIYGVMHIIIIIIII